MSTTVRVLCSGCMRSVSVSGERPAAAAFCPHCGAALDVAAAEPEESVEDLRVPLALTPPELIDSRASDGDPVVPPSVGRFQLRAAIGGGGFGLVYLAYDPRLDREVALKVLKDVDPGARVIERFFREARAAAQLDHPNIVALHDAGRDGSVCWIAYQFVRGRTLNDELAGPGPRSVTWAARIALALARALEHAHGRGVYHRDLKPANVLLDETGRPRLTDFGLARRVGIDPMLTSDGGVIGTPAYMSPEQAAGRNEVVDQRSDLFSLGRIMAEMLGERPGEMPPGPSWHGAATPPRSREFGRVPRRLQRVCARALATQPSDRYPSARAMADDIEAWLASRRDTRPGRTRRRLSWWASFAAGAVLALTLSQLARWGSTAAPPLAAPDRVRVLPVRPAATLEPFVRLRETTVVHRSGCLIVRQRPGADWVPCPEPGSVGGANLDACALCFGDG